ncbi:protein twisted gastrulation [Drosophila innubila]|uniref:protein twisted gastrulation n=1 Tax=Drosophila innubila TaxID=198719 RepID=UPI00148C0F1A|nr:protein twisted gastrulation [Drosophila innubila]
MWRFVFFVISFGLATANEDGCNEMICGSVVSKCQLTQSCQCKLNDCHCCKDCLNCLGELYTECCGCLDMCPKQKDVQSSMTPRSEIGDVDGLPELFDTLTTEDDDQWSTIRISMRAGTKQRLEGNSQSLHQANYNLNDSVNCTVIYVNSCIRSLKCKQQCESMGASSYRWFHNGCCECVGALCLNYGINESRCTECPDDQEAVSDDTVNMDAEQDMEHIFGIKDDAPNDMWDYGEDDDMT